MILYKEVTLFKDPLKTSQLREKAEAHTTDSKVCSSSVLHHSLSSSPAALPLRQGAGPL